MRFAPAAAALSLVALVSASVAVSAQREPDPRSASLVAEGRAQLQSGDTQAAIDSFEAALAIDPAHSEVYIYLAEAARANGLQGKAIHYYREMLERDPDNLAALSGEGAALVEKGAVEKAREKLAELQNVCGGACPEAQQLAAAITRGPLPAMASNEAAPVEEPVAQN